MIPPAPQPISFTTAKGSTYEVGEGGTTTRNKAARPDVGHEGDFGPQAPSEATYYVTPEQSLMLAEIQTQGRQPAVIAAMPDGRIGMRYTEGPSAGKFERRTVVTPAREPAVGMTPVELWDGGKKVHFGNEITEVTHAAPRPEPVAAPAIPRESNNALPPRDSVKLEGDEPAPRGTEVGAPEGIAAAKGEGVEPNVDTQLAQRIAMDTPDLLVTLPGSDHPMTAVEAMARIAEEQKSDEQWADLLKVATECALGA